MKNSVFKHFLKDCNDVQLLIPWDKLFQILGALNEKALPTNAFGGMGVFKEMLADDRRVLVGLYICIHSISQLDLEYMMVTNYLMT